MTRAKSGDMIALSMVNPCATAIDIGSTMHVAAINPDADDNPIQAFDTFTGDLHDMIRWFKECGVTSVAMETPVFTGFQPTKCLKSTALT